MNHSANLYCPDRFINSVVSLKPYLHIYNMVNSRMCVCGCVLVDVLYVVDIQVISPTIIILNHDECIHRENHWV